MTASRLPTATRSPTEHKAVRQGRRGAEGRFLIRETDDEVSPESGRRRVYPDIPRHLHLPAPSPSPCRRGLDRQVGRGWTDSGRPCRGREARRGTRPLASPGCSAPPRRWALRPSATGRLTLGLRAEAARLNTRIYSWGSHGWSVLPGPTAGDVGSAPSGLLKPDPAGRSHIRIFNPALPQSPGSTPPQHSRGLPAGSDPINRSGCRSQGPPTIISASPPVFLAGLGTGDCFLAPGGESR
jgi:hypothetical protein